MLLSVRSGEARCRSREKLERILQFCESQFAGGEHGTPCTVTQGKPRGPAQNARGWEGECGKVPLLWFQWEGKGKAGQAGLGLADLNISRFWCIRAIPACLVPGPVTVKVGLWWPGV